jgi:hypothetical protein
VLSTLNPQPTHCTALLWSYFPGVPQGPISLDRRTESESVVVEELAERLQVDVCAVSGGVLQICGFWDYEGLRADLTLRLQVGGAACC